VRQRECVCANTVRADPIRSCTVNQVMLSNQVMYGAVLCAELCERESVQGKD